MQYQTYHDTTKYSNHPSSVGFALFLNSVVWLKWAALTCSCTPSCVFCCGGRSSKVQHNVVKAVFRDEERRLVSVGVG